MITGAINFTTNFGIIKWRKTSYLALNKIGYMYVYLDNDGNLNNIDYEKCYLRSL